MISAGLNPVDYKMPHFPHLRSARKGTVAGMDVCGTILALGLSVEALAVNEVQLGCWYGLEEIAIVKASMVAKVPKCAKNLAIYGALGIPYSHEGKGIARS